MPGSSSYIRWFEELTREDVSQAGGKNSSLGEMIAALKEKGIQVPDGFATSAQVYRGYLEANGSEEEIRSAIDDFHVGRQSLEETGATIRKLIQGGEIPQEIASAIVHAYRELGRRYRRKDVDFTARSSATAEDLPEASFAGQQESFFNGSGENGLLEACRSCFASLFTDRAIVYREEQGFDHMDGFLRRGRSGLRQLCLTEGRSYGQRPKNREPE